MPSLSCKRILRLEGSGDRQWSFQQAPTSQYSNKNSQIISFVLTWFSSVRDLSYHARTGSSVKPVRNDSRDLSNVQVTWGREDGGVGWHSTISNNLRWARTTTWNRNSKRGRCIETRQWLDNVTTAVWNVKSTCKRLITTMVWLSRNFKWT